MKKKLSYLKRINKSRRGAAHPLISSSQPDSGELWEQAIITRMTQKQSQDATWGEVEGGVGGI